MKHLMVICMNKMSDQTLQYYNQNAGSYVSSTRDVDLSATQLKFLKLLPRGGRILDLGCGSGRDTKYFLEQGFEVDAVDGSEELARMAAEYTGVNVRKMLFCELSEVEKYDGIWACSSILHLPWPELADVTGRMCTALKPGGIIYSSFKYGDFSGERNGRYFTDLTEKTFKELTDNYAALQIIETWLSTDVRPGREDEKWLNAILQKSDTI